MEEKKYYTKEFYNNLQDKNTKTAKEMIPYIINCIKPRSVVDVGCGRGIFLKEVNVINPDIQILGIDGDYVEPDELLIKKEYFYPFDLSKELKLKSTFDLAISLEVAEHLNEEWANTFIDNITKLSDVIVFSAAMPMQGGTHHVNEQWPSYWKNKFEERGYQASDCLRRYFWENENIDPLRRQNIMLYVKNEKFEYVERCFERREEFLFDIVHPEFWIDRYSKCKQQVEYLQAICLKQREIIDSILKNKVDDLTELISEMSLFDLVDNLNLLEYVKQVNPSFFDNIETEIDRVSKTMQQEKFIVWGAGEEGKKIEQLFCVIGKNVTKVCDSVKREKNIFSIEDMVNEYEGEIIVIASRKYYDEIMNMIDEMRNIKQFRIYPCIVKN